MKRILLGLCFISSLTFAQTPSLIIKSGLQSEAVFSAISPDNKLGLTVEDNEVLILWEFSTGRQLQSYTGVMAADFGEQPGTLEVVTNTYNFETWDYSGKILRQTNFSHQGNDRFNRLSLSFSAAEGILLENGRVYTRDKGYLGRVDINGGYSQIQEYSPTLDLMGIGWQNDVRLAKIDDPNFKQTISFKLKSQFENRADEIRYVHFSSDGKYMVAGNILSLEVKELATDRTVLTFSFSEEEGNAVIGGANFSLDSEQLLILGNERVVLLDLMSGNRLWSISAPGISVNQYGDNSISTEFSLDGSRLLVGSLTTLLYLDSKSGATISKIQGITNIPVNYHHLSKEANSLILEQNNNVIFWNLSSGGINRMFPAKKRDFTHFILAPDGKRLYNIWGYVDVATEKYTSLPSKPEYDNWQDQIALSYNGGLVAQSSDDDTKPKGDNAAVAEVVDTKTGKILWKKDRLNVIGFQRTEAILVGVDEWAPNTVIQFFDGQTGKLVKSIDLQKKIPILEIIFSANDSYMLLRNSAELLVVDMATSVSKSITQNLPDGFRIYAPTFTPDEKEILFGANESSILSYDLVSGEWDLSKLINTFTSGVRAITFAENPNLIFISRSEANLQLWDRSAKKLLATLYPDPETGEWAVVTPSGRFDASPEFQKQIYFAKGIETFPLEILFEQFYTPKLLPRILASETFPPTPTELEDLKEAPKVSITYEEIKRNLVVEDEITTYVNTSGMAAITVSASSENDLVEEIRLFHNGKVVNLATRGLFVTDDATKSQTKKYSITLLPGENNFRAIALNSQRVESKPSEIVVQFRTDADPVPTEVKRITGDFSPVDKRATLHLIVVGINAYQNPAMSLNYALADATAFKMEIEKDAKTIISNTKTYFVTDANASKNGILEAFKQVQQNAKAQDVFIFYYAGHGVIGKDKEFYLVPNDVSDLKNVQAELEQKGIAAKLMQQYAIDIQAQKQLFILDACQSAGAFNEMLATSGDQQKSIAVVSRSTGTHWMAASGAQQYANEFSQLGHGAFTYVLLEALKGSAAADKMITVNGLKNYLQQGVPELMKKYSGTLQYPASYGFGSDFPVEIVK